MTLAGEPIALTPTEFDILALLARNAGCVVTQRSILETVWGSEWAEDRQTLRAHVSNLRRKIERRPGGAEVRCDGARRGLQVLCGKRCAAGGRGAGGGVGVRCPSVAPP